MVGYLLSREQVMDRDPGLNGEDSDSEGHQDSRHEHDSDGAEAEVDLDGEAVHTDQLSAAEELDEMRTEFGLFRCDESVLETLRANQSGVIAMEYSFQEDVRGEPSLDIQKVKHVTARQEAE